MAEELELVEQACSRFRRNSDLSRVNTNPGHAVTVDPGVIKAVEIVLHAARVTDGRVDPTVGLVGDFSETTVTSPRSVRRVHRLRCAPSGSLGGNVSSSIRPATVRVPLGVQLDLGDGQGVCGSSRCRAHRDRARSGRADQPRWGHRGRWSASDRRMVDPRRPTTTPRGSRFPARPWHWARVGWRRPASPSAAGPRETRAVTTCSIRRPDSPSMDRSGP